MLSATSKTRKLLTISVFLITCGAPNIRRPCDSRNHPGVARHRRSGTGPKTLLAHLPVERHQEPGEQGEEKAVRADLKIEIPDRVKCDAEQGHRDTHAQDVEGMDSAPEGRPPVAPHEHHDSGQTEDRAHDTRLPEDLQVVVVRPVPPSWRSRWHVGGEAVLEGAEPRPHPEVVRQFVD